VTSSLDGLTSAVSHCCLTFSRDRSVASPHRRGFGSVVGMRTLQALILALNTALTGEGCRQDDLPRESATSPICTFKCFSGSRALICAGLGFDPNLPKGQSEPSDSRAVVSSVNSLLQIRSSELSEIPITSFLASTSSGHPPSSLAILTHRSGHLYVYLGQLRIENRDYCELVHGTSLPFLYDTSQMGSEGFVSAWVPRTANQQPIPIHFGSANLEIDHLFHNFGEVRPFTDVHTVIRLRNRGASSVILARPKTSCGCTVVNTDADSVIAPRETRELELRMQTSDSPSQRNSVFLSLFEKGALGSTNLSFELFAVQRGSLKITPSELDFGRLDRSKPAVVRTVLLSEVPSDRFELKSVAIGDAKHLSAAFAPEPSTNGLAAYRVSVRLEPADLSPGSNAHRIHLRTTSVLRPDIVLPVKWEVKPRVSCSPETLSFGAVDRGKAPHRSVSFISSNPADTYVVEVKSKPDGWIVQIEYQHGQPVLSIQPRFSKDGLLKEKIVLNFNGSTWHETTELTCVGIVRSF
jgi:hypothetical protein